MTARVLPFQEDPIEPAAPPALTVIVDGERIPGVQGQTIAGVLLAADTLTLRRTAGGDKPRGVFCGIGVCFDCLVEVNGLPNVRACQRRAVDGDVVATRVESDPARPTGSDAEVSGERHD